MSAVGPRFGGSYIASSMRFFHPPHMSVATAQAAARPAVTSGWRGGGEPTRSQFVCIEIFCELLPTDEGSNCSLVKHQAVSDHTHGRRAVCRCRFAKEHRPKVRPVFKTKRVYTVFM